MLTPDYLTLRLIRLKPPEEWRPPAEGLCFIFPKGGQGKYISKAVTHRLVSGDALIIQGGADGRLSVPDNGELVFWSFSLSLEHLYPLFATNEIHLLHTVSEEFKAPRLYASAHAVALACHRLLSDVTPQFDLEHRSQLLGVVSAILKPEFLQARGQRAGFIRVADHMIQVLETLSADQLLSLSVGELARKFSCSRRHLNRLFHQHFGFSVAALHMEMRMLKAVSLLRNPDAKVINVAELCGFNHLGLFNTCFRRRFGTSPGQWRKAGGRKETEAPVVPETDLNCPLRVNGLCPLTTKAGEGDAFAPLTAESATSGAPKALLRSLGHAAKGNLPTLSAKPNGGGYSPGIVIRPRCTPQSAA